METTHKNIKRAFAWLVVVFVGYVVLYTYLNPDFVKYYEDETARETMDYDPNIPIGKNNILMKEKNPLVFYVLKYQWVFLALGLLYWLIDMKKTKEFFSKVSSKYL